MKRELIDKEKLIKDVKESNAIDIVERMKFSNVVEHQKLITEEEIIKPYIDKLIAEIKAEIRKYGINSGMLLALEIINKKAKEYADAK